MVLDRKSLLVRWTYKFSEYPPDHTTLCRFFWRCFVWMPLAWAAICGGGGVLLACFIIANLDTHWLFGAGVAVAVLGTVGFMFGVENYAPKVKRFVRHTAQDVTASVVWQGAKAVKSRICPLIWIE